jgi:hypothetical protein
LLILILAVLLSLVVMISLILLRIIALLTITVSYGTIALLRILRLLLLLVILLICLLHWLLVEYGDAFKFLFEKGIWNEPVFFCDISEFKVDIIEYLVGVLVGVLDFFYWGDIREVGGEWL